MSYVLVALQDGKDAATQLTLGLAKHIERQKPPTHFFGQTHPPHQEVHDALLEHTPEETLATGLVFGHCGRREKTLRAQQAPIPCWTTPQEFGAIFPNARVYVFACETITSPSEREEHLSESFGDLAIEHGVKTFVGHHIEVGVPEPPPHWTTEQKELLQNATASVFFAFLNGEDSERALKKALLDAVEEDFWLDDLPEDINDGTTATGWGAALLLQQLRKSLVVLKRP